MKKEEIYLDLSKCSEEEIENLLLFLNKIESNWKKKYLQFPSRTIQLQENCNYLIRTYTLTKGKIEISISEFIRLFEVDKCDEKTKKEVFIKLAKDNLFALESYQMNEFGEKPLEVFGIEKFYDELFQSEENAQVPTSKEVLQVENNEWIKIKSENDLPTKNIDCFCLLKKGNIIICNSRQTHFWCSDNKWLYNFYDFTHYQPIIKPEPPTF